MLCYHIRAMDSIDARLLDFLQQGLPLVARPFNDLAARLGISERDVISRIKRLKSDSVIRQISAIFDSAAIGYHSALVAFRIDERMVGSVADIVVAHPGVSHCYSRDADYNLWFTITTAPGSNMEAEVRTLAGSSEVEDYLILPALKIFKIGVFLRMSDESPAPTAQPASNHARCAELSEFDRAAICVLQRDLPVIDRPFAELASLAGMGEAVLLDLAREYIECGLMRRFSAVLHHNRAGYASNAMVCWRVEPEQLDEVGRELAVDPSVSHCYERPASEKWPYSLYTMVHARSPEELESTIDRLAATASCERLVLWTIKGYKKSRVLYFTGD